MDKELKDIVFCIVGLGLIGGSYAKALRRLGVKKISAVDSDKAVLVQALEEGVIDAPCSVPEDRIFNVSIRSVFVCFIPSQKKQSTTLYTLLSDLFSSNSCYYDL